jgi:replication-associated recombination protein RarA
MSKAPLDEKYKPARLADFAGISAAKAILGKFAAKPYPSAWLLLGQSGLGKTTAALALASAIGAEVHRIASKNCTLESVESVCRSCHYYPVAGNWHVVIVDEADQMSAAAQLAFLSKLDGTDTPPATIFLFTANGTALLKDRFLSRCRTVRFSTEGILEEGAELLGRIFRAEAPGRPEPDYAALLRVSACNMRAAILNLELEMLSPGAWAPPPVPVVAGIAPPPGNGPQPGGDLVNAHEFAGLLNIKVETLYRRITKGAIPWGAGRPMKWERSAIQPFLDA